MKVFISQNMCGRKPEEILAARKEAEALVRKNHGEDVQIIDSYHPEFEKKLKPQVAMAKSLAMLAEADAMYIIGDPYIGGVQVERIFCETYNIPFVIIRRDEGCTAKGSF